MKLGSLASARPAWYDRNSVEGSAAFAANNGGFTNGFQFTYTVPTGKLFNIDSGFVGLWTSVAATANGFDQVALIFTPSGGSATTLLDGRLYIETAGLSVTQNFAGTVLMYPGGTIQGYAYSGQTGGTTGFSINYHGVQFDR